MSVGSGPRRPGSAGGSAAGDRPGFGTARLLVLAGAAVTAVGAFLPWLTTTYGLGSVTLRGVQTQGGITLALAVVVTVAVLFAWSRRTQTGVAIVGALVAAMAVLHVDDPSRGIDFTVWGIDVAAATTRAEPGLHVTVVGGILLLVGALLALRR